MAKATTAASSSRGVVADDRIETEAIEVGHERLERGRRLPIPIGAGDALVTSHLGGVVGVAVEPLCHVQHHPGQHRHRRWFEAERRCIGGDRVAVLRPTDVAATPDGDIEQADVAHPLEVWADRVRVELERLGDVGGGQRPRRPGEFEVDRVARVVTQRLQQIELPVPRTSPAVHKTRLHGIGR